MLSVIECAVRLGKVEKRGRERAELDLEEYYYSAPFTLMKEWVVAAFECEDKDLAKSIAALAYKAAEGKMLDGISILSRL